MKNLVRDFRVPIGRTKLRNLPHNCWESYQCGAGLDDVGARLSRDQMVQVLRGTKPGTSGVMPRCRRTPPSNRSINLLTT
jgi:hypothetical protein